MIKKADLFDVLNVMAMARKFAENSPFKSIYSKDKLNKVCLDAVTSNDKVVFISENGMLAGMITDFIYGDCKVATELAWWVEPEYRNSGEGKELIDAFETWAKDMGCSYITMVCLDDALGSYYEKRGYSLTERAYMKAL